jgi:hypothetical protein
VKVSYFHETYKISEGGLKISHRRDLEGGGIRANLKEIPAPPDPSIYECRSPAVLVLYALLQRVVNKLRHAS